MKEGDVVILSEEGKGVYIKRLWDKPIIVKNLSGDDCVYVEVEDFSNLLVKRSHVVPHDNYYQEIRETLQQIKEDAGIV